jgi:arabinose-5-phosphate isomerase
VPNENPLSSISTPSDALNVAAEASRKALRAARLGIEALESDANLSLVADWAVHVSQSKGRVVLCGMGKSGLVAQKIMATLASTGCPSFYLHPAEALHGDIGMVTAEDTMLILSNSGETEEVVRLLPNFLRLGVPIAAITSNGGSRLGRAARWCFTYAMPEGEGCPLNFAPMASTTLQIVWGDLLASYRMVHSGFTLERFAELHPAGNIGAKLLVNKDILHANFPWVGPEASIIEALDSMTHGKLGMTTVMAGSNLKGVISDGDIRRALEKAKQQNLNPLDMKAAEIMTLNPICISSETLAVESARIMESRKITFLVAIDEGEVKGVLHIHDLLSAKVI